MSGVARALEILNAVYKYDSSRIIRAISYNDVFTISRLVFYYAITVISFIRRILRIVTKAVNPNGFSM